MVVPKNVLHVLNNPSGGAAMSALALAERLRGYGIRSCAVCDSGGRPEDRHQLVECMDGPVEFLPLYWWNRKLRMPPWRRPLSECKQILRTGWALGSAARVAQFAVAWQADLIHTNTILTPEGGLAARRLGLPHVWHLRELLGPGNPFRLRREGTSFGHYMSRHCSKLVANSETSGALVRSWLGDGLLEVVPNGIDVERFTPRTDGRARGPLVVAMVGNLGSHTKRHALFVDAAARVDRALPIEWRIYGEDPSRGGAMRGSDYLDALRSQIAAADLTERMKFPGYVDDPTRIMAEIDILVHPAENESFGRIVVEAMAAGLAVVGPRAGGVAEIIVDGQTGLLAAPGDAVGLARAVEQLARDPKLRMSLGRRGRERAETRYSLKAMADRMVQVYERAMARPLGTPMVLPQDGAA